MAYVVEHDSEPGRFDSPLKDDYPGFVRFPVPLTYTQFKAWYEEAIIPSRGLQILDWQHWHSKWSGARLLIVEYGEWKVDGISIGDVKDDNVPLEVVEFVIAAARLYIERQLDPKRLAVLSTIM